MPLSPAPARLALVLASSLVTGNAWAIEHYEGHAYAKDQGKLLYRESHWIRDSGERLVLYRCPDGTPFARKQVSGAGIAPDFALIDARDGYREGVRTANGMRQVYTQASTSAREQAKPVPMRGNQIIDAGFDTYLRQQWPSLKANTSRQIDFLVPSRLQTMKFRLGALPGDGATQRYKLALDAWYGGALPSIVVTYSVKDRRLLAFEGPSNLRDASLGKHPAVRIEFPVDKHGQASASDLLNASRTPLARKCST